MEPHDDLRTLTDAQLLGRLSELLRQSRRFEVELIAHIGEVDARRLYLHEAAPSMFVYATRDLHLSEAEAYLRIAVARASREHPALLTMLAAGQIHLSGAALLGPHLTVANREAVLARASHRSKRQIEELVAELAPRPAAPASIRKLPEPRAATTVVPTDFALREDPEKAPEPGAGQLRPDRVGFAPAPGRRGIVGGTQPSSQPERSRRRAEVLEPIDRGRYRVQFTAGVTLRDKLERLQALCPGTELAVLVEQAVTEKLERLEARRFGATKGPRKPLAEAETSSDSRYIPAPVRRAVYERDGGRCAFVDARGRRCNERRQLEFHHRYPKGYGGDRSPDNISLQCRPHNVHLAEIDYGKASMDLHRHGLG